ncbi:GAF domain-containing protein [soil metagenome]
MAERAPSLDSLIDQLLRLARADEIDDDPRLHESGCHELVTQVAESAVQLNLRADEVIGRLALAAHTDPLKSSSHAGTIGRLILRLREALEACTETPGTAVREAHLLTHLRPICQAVTLDQPLTVRLDTIAERIATAMSLDACTIFLHDEATKALALRAAWGMDPATVGAVTLRVGAGIAGQAAMDQRTIVATDARAHRSFLDHPGLGDEQFTTQVSTPMIVNGPERLIGVLSVHSLKERNTAAYELDFLESVSSLLAVTIDTERRSTQTDVELQRKITELSTLQRVSRVVASTLDLSEVLKLITEQAVELINAEAAAIFRLPADHTDSQESLPTIEYRVGRLRDHEDEASRNVIVREVLQSGVARTRDISYVDGASSVFCLPLNTARETVGALCFRLRHGTSLDEEQLGLLQAFGDAAAIAIDNAGLYQEAITSIQTQSTLVQEMHHRVRNNLQTVAALLSLQLRSDEDAPWSHELREAVSRIQSIAAVHDIMSDASRLAGTTVDVIARLVAEDAHSTLIPPGLNITFDIPESTLTVPSGQATIIALLINELTANAIHHGFSGRERGRITITGNQEYGAATIQVINDGVRIAKGFKPAESSGLGMRITQRLVTSDLRGSFSIRPTESGTIATIQFPLAPEDPAPTD